MATVREVFRLRLDRLQEREARLVADVTAVRAQIDHLQALRAAVTADHETVLQQLQDAGIVKAED